MRADIRNIALGTLGYSVLTFTWAVAWHVGLFRAAYEEWGYIDDDPNFAAGLLSIVVQGAALSWLFPRVRFAGGATVRGLKFGAAAGLFYWTCHVLAFAAKEDAANAPLFYVLETLYLAAQFAMFGLLIGKIHAKAAGEKAS